MMHIGLRVLTTEHSPDSGQALPQIVKATKTGLELLVTVSRCLCLFVLLGSTFDFRSVRLRDMEAVENYREL